VSRVLHLGRELFVRDFKLRHRRAALGCLWAILPLALTGVVVTQVGARLGVAERPAGAAPFLLEVFLGIVVLQTFVDALDAPQQVARRSRGLLLRVPFPREALLVAGAGFVGFNLLVRSMFLALLCAQQGVAPAASAPLALACLALVALCGLALGAALAPVSLLLWDVRFGLPYLTTLLYLATPIFYPPAQGGLLGAVNALNPLTHVALAARELLFVGAGRGALVVALALALAAAALASAGLTYFRRAMPRACPHLA
jgi:lipopolysaccharide transport system permease protein